MQLRPYQTEAIDAVLRHWQQGDRSVLGVAATGAGKTVMFTALLTRLLDGTRRGLILAHRQELIDQPIERLRAVAGAWLQPTGVTLSRPRVGIVMAQANDCDRELTIATVQTLASEKRLAQLLAHGPIDYLITDEAHHAVAPSYLAVYDALRAANPDLRHLGVTATPVRQDEIGLVNEFPVQAFHYGIKELVQLRYLVPPKWLGIATDVDVRGVASRGGDFVASQLAPRCDTPAAHALIVQTHLQFARGRRSIAFTASVAGAYALAERFRAAGVSAAAADGTTPKDTRRQLLADFRAGRIEVLCNAQLFTEGLDVPEISCVHMTRPTRSDAFYVQCIGRGLRPVPDKADCLILDYLPADTRNVAMLGDVLGLPIPREELLKRFAKGTEPGSVQAGFTFDGETFDMDGTPLEIVARELHYLDASPYRWHSRDGWLTLGLGKASDGNERILVVPPTDGQGYTLYGLLRSDGGSWRRRLLCTHTDLQAIGSEAEAVASRWGNAALTGKARHWHAQPASDGQRQYLKRLARGALKGRDIDLLDRGTCAGLINHYIAVRALSGAQEGVAA